MSLTPKLDSLVKQITQNADLSPAQADHFKKLAEANEASIETSAAIEPDDDYMANDAKLLPVLDDQEDLYATLLEDADAVVGEAFEEYLKERKDHLD